MFVFRNRVIFAVDKVTFGDYIPNNFSLEGPISHSPGRRVLSITKAIEVPPVADTPVSKPVADFLQCRRIPLDDPSQARRILLQLT